MIPVSNPSAPPSILDRYQREEAAVRRAARVLRTTAAHPRGDDCSPQQQASARALALVHLRAGVA